jgi:hypothetical protein
LKRRKRRALVTTETLENAIAADAMTGLSKPAALGQFIADLRSGTFRRGLRVKRVQRHRHLGDDRGSRRTSHVRIR